MPNLEITARERSALRASAHALRPVVLIGDRGLSDAVLKEIDRSLTAHGLIKVRAGGEDRDAREAMMAEICDALSCAPVHHLGKMLILYRPRADEAPARAPSAPARRKASEPHTPKKLAAQGKTLTRQDVRAARKAAAAAPAAVAPGRTGTAGRAPRPGTWAAAAGPSHGIPRRSGSALSLRAGARGQRTTATSRKPTKATKR